MLAKLREKGLKPAPAATRSVLLRRATFDLWGLPPTPGQAERFLRDESSDAYERLIEELLESPRYGERWGRHWLNVVGYADSRTDSDDYHPNAWRYRDYVIKSFNEDKPYDRFVQEQIAGDELFPNNLELEGFYDLSPEKLEHLEAWIGTTIFALGPVGGQAALDAEAARYRWLTRVVDKTASSFLGLTLECARCHDHRSDPFSQEDYFRLQAIFAASRPSTIPVVASTTMGHRDEAYHLSIALVEARDAYLRFAGNIRDRVVETRKRDYPSEVAQAYETPAEERSARETELAVPLARLHRKLKIEEHLTPEEAERHRELTRKLAKAAVLIPAKGLAHKVDYDGFYDVPSATVLAGWKTELIPETHLLKLGELAGKQFPVHPGLPRALWHENVPARLSRQPNGPHYRKQLALWLTEPTHPLTARVMVNRIWQGHYGQGPGSHCRRLRPPRRLPRPSGAAGLARQPVGGSGLEREIDAPAGHAVRHLSEGQSVYFGQAPAARSLESLLVAHESTQVGEDGRLGCHPPGVGRPESEDGRSPGHPTPGGSGRGHLSNEDPVARLRRSDRGPSPRDLPLVPTGSLAVPPCNRRPILERLSRQERRQ